LKKDGNLIMAKIIKVIQRMEKLCDVIKTLIDIRAGINPSSAAGDNFAFLGGHHAHDGRRK
jgi:hypothetical protein